MQTLWLAIFIYSVGLGIILHTRPKLMFNQNGSWKEFGYNRDSRYTLFPVWLFAIVWAVVSYVIAIAVCSSMQSDDSTTAMAGTAIAATYLSEQDWIEPPPDPEPEPMHMEPPVLSERRPRGRPRKQPRPGYYLLDPETERVGGLRKYIYYSSAPPPNSVMERPEPTFQ